MNDICKIKIASRDKTLGARVSVAANPGCLIDIEIKATVPTSSETEKIEAAIEKCVNEIWNAIPDEETNITAS